MISSSLRKPLGNKLGVVKVVLDLFCKSFSQKVNQNKSCIFFSKNVCYRRCEELSNLFGCRHTSNLGKCLGVPLLYEKCKVQDFQFIVDHMNQRLSGWKARTLSLVGRITLA